MITSKKICGANGYMTRKDRLNLDKKYRWCVAGVVLDAWPLTLTIDEKNIMHNT
jgi:hypothetical protein